MDSILDWLAGNWFAPLVAVALMGVRLYFTEFRPASISVEVLGEVQWGGRRGIGGSLDPDVVLVHLNFSASNAGAGVGWLEHPIEVEVETDGPLIEDAAGGKVEPAELPRVEGDRAERLHFSFELTGPAQTLRDSQYLYGHEEADRRRDVACLLRDQSPVRFRLCVPYHRAGPVFGRPRKDVARSDWIDLDVGAAKEIAIEKWQREEHGRELAAIALGEKEWNLKYFATA